MGSLFTSLGSHRRVQAVLLGWALPLLLLSFLFVIVVLPEVRTSAVVDQVRRGVVLLRINRSLFVVLATVAIATLMSLNRTFLYRALEGVAWPEFLRKWRIERGHRPHWGYLVADRNYQAIKKDRESREQEAQQLLEHRKATGKDVEAYLKQLEGWLEPIRSEEALLRQVRDEASTRRRNRGRDPVPWWGRLVPRRGRPAFMPRPRKHGDTVALPSYPQKPEQVMATRIGNALRAAETYGANVFGIDSQIMWYELYAVAPDAVQSTIEDAELEADTFVCLLFGVAAFGFAAALGAVWREATGDGSVRLWITAVVCILLLSVLHRGLLTSIGEWQAGIQAMVNTGREPLRAKFELRRPRTAAEETEMWQALVGAVWHGDRESRDRLATFQVNDDEAQRATKPQELVVTLRLEGTSDSNSQAGEPKEKLPDPKSAGGGAGETKQRGRTKRATPDRPERRSAPPRPGAST